MGFNIKDIGWGLKRLGLKAWNHRADIAFVTGTVGTGVGTYLFVKASKKNAPVIEEYKAKKKEIAENENYTDEEKRHETRENTLMVAKKSAKNYALPVVVSGASYGLQIYSHIKKTSDLAVKNAALTASVAAYEALMAKIIESEGEDRWRELAYGENRMDVGDINEDGSVTMNTVTDLGTRGIDFSFPFDDSVDATGKPLCTEWQEAKGANKARLCILESTWDDKLQRSGKKGIIFLRPVFESVFGSLKAFPAEWANAGWPAMNPDGTINHISFGFRPTDGRPIETFPQSTQDFWNEKSNNVRIVFEGVVPNVYDVI